MKLRDRKAMGETYPKKDGFAMKLLFQGIKEALVVAFFSSVTNLFSFMSHYFIIVVKHLLSDGHS